MSLQQKQLSSYEELGCTNIANYPTMKAVIKEPACRRDELVKLQRQFDVVGVLTHPVTVHVSVVQLIPSEHLVLL